MAQPCPKPAPSPAADLQQRPKERWNARRTAIFLDHLAMTCNVTEALQMSGMSSASLFRRRRECPEFSRAWDQALDEGYRRLEAELLNRALNGETQEVVNRNGDVVTIRKSCNTLGLALLKIRATRAALQDELQRRLNGGKTDEEHALELKMKLLKRLQQLTDHKAREIEEAKARTEPANSPQAEPEPAFYQSNSGNYCEM